MVYDNTTNFRQIFGIIPYITTGSFSGIFVWNILDKAFLKLANRTNNYRDIETNTIFGYLFGCIFGYHCYIKTLRLN